VVATTATASSETSTARTPFTTSARALSTLPTFPPITGHTAMAATFIPLTLASTPNCAIPFTLLGVSVRCAGVPTSRKSAGFFSGASAGTGNAEARPTSASYRAVRPVGT
jgi:hypothetical protein